MRKLFNLLPILTLLGSSISFADRIKCDFTNIDIEINQDNQISEEFEFRNQKYNFEVISGLDHENSLIKRDLYNIVLLIRKNNKIVSETVQFTSDDVPTGIYDENNKLILECHLRPSGEGLVGPLSRMAARNLLLKLKSAVANLKYLENIIGGSPGNIENLLKRIDSDLDVLSEYRFSSMRAFLNRDEYLKLSNLELALYDSLPHLRPIDLIDIKIVRESLETLLTREFEIVRYLGLN